jgi:two-component system, cell cycle sensor histidine kinase and response regulator CckA
MQSQATAISVFASTSAGDRSPDAPGTEPGTDDPDVSPSAAVETILVVDDDPSVLQVASKVLSRGGFDVLEASGGEEALRVAEECGGQISLLLTDVVMPGMGGRELSEAFCERYPQVRILFMSAYTEDEVILQGVRVAEVNFISKPFTVQGLRDKVRQVLDYEEN